MQPRQGSVGPVHVVTVSRAVVADIREVLLHSKGSCHSSSRTPQTAAVGLVHRRQQLVGASRAQAQLQRALGCQGHVGGLHLACLLVLQQHLTLQLRQAQG
jgi:hypothetical protein